MPIYITKNVQFPTRVEAFERRGLSGQVASKVSECGIMPVMSTPVANILRYAFVADELVARRNGQAALYTGNAAAILRDFSGSSPFEGPLLFVEMKSGGEVLNGYGLFEVGTGKIGCFGGHPTEDSLRSICGLGIDFYQTVPAGNANIAAYIAWVQAWRGIRAFYAIGGGQANIITVGISKNAAYAVRAIDPVPEQKDENGRVTRAGVPGRDGGGFVSMVETSFLTGRNMATDGVELIEPAAVEDLHGQVFPYFKEMLEPDADHTYGVFMRLFRLCLEDQPERMLEAVAVHRRGFRYLMNTTAGRILQHIYFGIDLAIGCGAKLYLIQDGAEYGGFVLENKDLLLCVKNHVVKALVPEDVSKELIALNSHAAAVAKIHELLVEVRRVDGAEETSTVEQLRYNPRLIRSMVQDRAQADIEPLRKVIAENLAETKYSQAYWEITPANLIRFVDAIRQRIPMRDQPMYVHPDVIFNRSSRILEYLSVFGGQAPSIYHGSSLKQIARPGADDPNLVVSAGRRQVPHIPWVKKGIIAAAADWATTLRNKSFRYTPARRNEQGGGFSSAKSRDGIVANPQFDAFYSGLRELVYQHEEERPRQVQTKRPREASGDDEGMSRPAKRVGYTFA